MPRPPKKARITRRPASSSLTIADDDVVNNGLPLPAMSSQETLPLPADERLAVPVTPVASAGTVTPVDSAGTATPLAAADPKDSVQVDSAGPATPLAAADPKDSVLSAAAATPLASAGSKASVPSAGTAPPLPSSVPKDAVHNQQGAKKPGHGAWDVLSLQFCFMSCPVVWISGFGAYEKGLLEFV